MSDTPLAWIIPGDDNENMNGFLDCKVIQDGEFTRPVYSQETLDSIKRDLIQANRRLWQVWRDGEVRHIAPDLTYAEWLDDLDLDRGAKLPNPAP